MLSPARAHLGFLLGLALTALLGAPAEATVIIENLTETDVIPGIAGFQTTGADMSGMTVTVGFGNGATEMATWTAGMGDSGGAFGTGWSLTLDGDSFTTPWEFTVNTDLGVSGFALDGAPGLTLFDRTFGGVEGTPGSALGLDFAESPTMAGTVVYARRVAVGMNLPVGDIWHMINVRLDQPVFESFTFDQDTDNDVRRPPRVPEPSTVVILGAAALALLGFHRRRS